MSMLDVWRLDDIERKANNAQQRLYELDTIARDVDRLERENKTLSACVDGLRATCEALLSRTEALESALAALDGGR